MTPRALALAGKPLHEALAQADWKTVRKNAAAMTAPRCPGAIDHELISRPDFFDAVTAALLPKCRPAVAA